MKHIKVPIRRLTKFSTRRIAMNKASKARRLMTLCMSLLLVIAGSAITAPTASANDVTATVFDTPEVRYVWMRNGPGTNYNTLGQLGAGTSITLECHSYGSQVNAPYGATNIWYKLKGRDNAWVNDGYIYTGSDEPVTGACADTAEKPKASAPAQKYNRTAAVQWAKAHVYDHERFDHGLDCTWYVSQALWAGGLPKSSAWTSDNAFPSFNPPKAASGADYLKNHLVKDTGMATITELSWSDNTAGGAQLGDLIAYDWDNGADGVIDHHAIVTDFTAEGYPVVSQHSHAQLKRYWSYSETGKDWVENTNKGARVYLIHITY